MVRASRSDGVTGEAWRDRWWRAAASTALRLVVIIVASGLATWPAGTADAQAVERSVATVTAPGQDAVRLHVEERGSGPPLLLLHGLGASTYFWRLVAPRLAATHRVIAIDLKGFGRSAKPDDGRYSILDQARLVRAFLIQRGLDRVTVIGHSLGGAIALALALDSRTAAPTLVHRLVLIAAPGLPQEIPEPIAILQRPGVGELALELAPATLVAKLTLYGATLDTSRITSRDIAAYAAPLEAPGGKAALIATARALDAERFGRLIARYPTLAVPTMLVWCRGDRIVPLETGKRLARLLPRARLQVLEGCNHLPPEERPAELVGRIRSFIAP